MATVNEINFWWLFLVQKPKNTTQKAKNTRKSYQKMMSFRCLFRVLWIEFWRWGVISFCKAIGHFFKDLINWSNEVFRKSRIKQRHHYYSSKCRHTQKNTKYKKRHKSKYLLLLPGLRSNKYIVAAQNFINWSLSNRTYEYFRAICRSLSIFIRC